MKFEDLLGLGKALSEPLTKLLDVVSIGIGRVSKSYFDRKDIDNEIYKKKELAKAEAYSIGVISEAINKLEQPEKFEYKDEKIVIIKNSREQKLAISNSSIDKRISDRRKFQEIKKQENIENITSLASNELLLETTVSQEQVDEDWINKFFKYAEDVSDEQMQILWGKILAGEIKKSNSYSIRTLEVLKNLTKYEAEIFMKFAKLSIIAFNSAGSPTFVLNPTKFDFMEKEYNVTFNDFLLLSEIGLLLSNELSYTINEQHGLRKPELWFVSGKDCFKLHILGKRKKTVIRTWNYSSIGKELLKLISFEPSQKFISQIKEVICNGDFENIKFYHGKISKWSDDRKLFRHIGLKEI